VEECSIRLLCETGLPFSSDDLQLVRDEVVSITVSNGTKKHISVFAASPPSNFIASHLRTATKIEATIDTVATQLADSCVVLSTITIGGLTLTPTRFVTSSIASRLMSYYNSDLLRLGNRFVIQ
jgi:hypothetical protein